MLRDISTFTLRWWLPTYSSSTRSSMSMVEMAMLTRVLCTTECMLWVVRSTSDEHRLPCATRQPP